MAKNNIYTRRNFVRTASCAALGSTTLLSSLINLKAINAAVANAMYAPGGDYKALVCILLEGGMDSYNFLIPRGNTEYDEYAAARANLAIDQSELLPIYPTISDGKEYGLHPAVSGIQNLFNTGKLSLMANVGTMIFPTSKSQYLTKSVQLPLGMLSHSDQIKHWQTGRPHERTDTGWGGRVADLINSMNTNENISMNISLSGNNVFQHGENIGEFVIDSDGALTVNGYGSPGLYDSIRTNALNSIMDASYADVFKQSYVNTVKASNIAGQEFIEAVNPVPDFLTSFSSYQLSQELKMIAKVIAARDTLGFSRQIFFIEFKGWDHHDNVLNNQNVMLPELSAGLSEFNSVLEELGVFDSVSTFTISDFGRTLTSNGNGSDHAWGGNAMMMGGSVNGGEIFGTFPSLALSGPDEVGNGILLPSTSTDEYLSELSYWFGVPSSDLPMIFPNLNNFFSYGAPGSLPIGFMNV